MNETPIHNQSNISEYVVLQTVQMDLSKTSSNNDSLTLLLQESDSVTNFRRFLDSINRGHYLDFYFACQGYRNYFTKSDSHKLYQLTKVIYRAYIRSESPFAVPLRLLTKQNIVDQLTDRSCLINQSVFDSAQNEVKELLSGDLLQNFLSSSFNKDYQVDKSNSYNQLLNADNINSNNDSTANASNAIYLDNTKGNNPAVDGSMNSSLTASTVPPHTLAALTNHTADNSNEQQQQQNSTTTSSQPNNNNNNTTSINISDKERHNLSEVDPPAFAKIVYDKLEQVQHEQMKFERLMHLMSRAATPAANNNTTAESDTDDSTTGGSSSRAAINFLLKYQQQQQQQQQQYVPGALITKTTRRLKSNGMAANSRSTSRSNCNPLPVNQSDDAAHILENHCSRIGAEFGLDLVPQPPSLATDINRSHSNSRVHQHHRTRCEVELGGSTTSYDSGVATSSLEQYSQLGTNGSCLLGGSALPPLPRRQQQQQQQAPPSQQQRKMYSCRTGLNANPLSDVSSTAFDSGVSSAYENFNRPIYNFDDKVTSWISQSHPEDPCHPIIYPRRLGSPPPVPPLPPGRSTSSNNGGSIPPNTPQIPHSTSAQRLLQVYSPSHHQQQQPPPSTTQSHYQHLHFVHNNNNNNKICQCSSTSHCSGLIGDSNNKILSDYSSEPPDKPEMNVQSKSSLSNTTITQGPLIIGYYIGNDPVPYRTQVPDVAPSSSITLGQFKSIVAKKGNFRYFFKQYCDEFECGVVHEEISKDDSLLPLWEGKIVAKIEKTD